MADSPIKHVDARGAYVDENDEKAAYTVNTNDPDSGKFVDGLRKKSGYTPPSEQVIPAPEAENEDGPDFSESLKNKLVAAGLVDEDSLKSATDEQLNLAGLVASQIQKFRSVYPAE